MDNLYFFIGFINLYFLIRGEIYLLFIIILLFYLLEKIILVYFRINQNNGTRKTVQLV